MRPAKGVMIKLVRSVVPKAICADEDVLATLSEHAKRRLKHAVNLIARRRGSNEKQAWLWLRPAVARHCSRNPLG
jgi:hypothetical protein